jgi:hypothetical protein
MSEILGEVLIRRREGLVTDLDRGFGADWCAGGGVLHRRAGEQGLRRVAARGELSRTGWVKLEGALVRISDDFDFGVRLRLMQRRVSPLRHLFEDEEIRGRAEQATSENYRLTADTVRECAEHKEEPSADSQRPSNQNVCGEAVDFEDRLHEEQGIELTRIPDHGLTGDEAEERENCNPAVLVCRDVSAD